MGIEADRRVGLHTCMLCEAVCGLTVQMEGASVRDVRGDRDDPFSRGHVCPKAAAIVDVQADPDRILEPQRRDGTSWQAISWESALEEAGQRLAAIQRKHGRSSVGIYLGNPTVHSYSAMLGVPFLLRAVGSRARFSATSVDQLPAMLAALEMFGHQLLLPIPDVDRTQFFLMLGANPWASNGSLMTAGGIARRIEEMRARGGRLVVVDPRRTETAVHADQHLSIRPGTDALLLLAMLHVVFEEERVQLRHLASSANGLPALQDAARRFSPERVETRTGIPAGEIRALARAFAAAPSAVAYGRVGTCTQEFGGLTTNDEFHDYHLVVEWRWGERTWAPRKDKTRDSGILVHCVGDDGAAGGNWMESQECQVIEGGCGDFIMVRGKNRPSLTCETRVGPDRQLYFEKGGKAVTSNSVRFNWWGRDPAWKDVLGFRGGRDVEKPAGEWNRMEVVCDGDSITTILNGYVVNIGTKSSLTRGKILFQSEGAEILFRKIEVRPLIK